MNSRLAALALIALATVGSALAEVPQSSNDMPRALRGVAYDQRIGEQVPLDLAFTSETGEAVRLGDLVKDKPVVLALVYYECPMLCTLVLNGLTSSMKALEFSAGEEFDVIAISFDASEGPELARDKKAAYLARYGREGASDGWHFLTGTQDSIDAITESVGFSYNYDEEKDLFAHAAGIMVLTPRGNIARYLYGIEYAPRDLKLSLIEAADEKLGSVVDQLLLFCFHYEADLGKYSAAVMNIMRGGAVLTVFLITVAVGTMIRRESRRKAVEV